jgi:hypothetical protein
VRAIDDQHHIGNVVVEQSAQSHQFCPLNLGGNNLGIIGTVSQHLNLKGKPLEPGDRIAA